MRRILSTLYLKFAILLRLISNASYMKLLLKAYEFRGVVFNGKPEYIHYDSYLDCSGGLTIGRDVVISTKVIILSHDYSFLKREGYSRDNECIARNAFRAVTIGDNCFIGAGAIILPGTTIGHSSIVGAGAVVKGIIEDNSIVVGSPARVIGKTR